MCLAFNCLFSGFYILQIKSISKFSITVQRSYSKKTSTRAWQLPAWWGLVTGSLGASKVNMLMCAFGRGCVKTQKLASYQILLTKIRFFSRSYSNTFWFVTVEIVRFYVATRFYFSKLIFSFHTASARSGRSPSLYQFHFSSKEQTFSSQKLIHKMTHISSCTHQSSIDWTTIT